VFCALAFIFRSVGLLIIGRAIDGLTAGDQPIAQAAVVDICPEEKRPTFIGLVLLSFTAGLIFGPVIGGFTSDSNLVSWFNNTTPMYLGAILSIIAFLGLIFFFKDTSKTKRDIKVSFIRPLIIFVEAFKHRSVRYLLIAFGLVQLGWSMYYLYITNFETKVYHFTVHQVSLYMSLLGIGFTIGLGILPRYFSKIPNQKLVASFGYLLLGIGIFCAAYFFNIAVFWTLTFVIAIAMTVAYTAIMPIFAKQVSEDRLGWVMGLTGSMLALAASIAAILAGFLSQISYATPLYTGFVCLIIGGIAIALFKPRVSK
jgi:predicted MFS family arabinose efflux permease